MPEPNAIQILLALVDEAFDRQAWHGPTLRGSLRGVTPAQAQWRPAPGRHNIRELTVHAAYWKYAVRRRLNGEKRGSFALKGSNWFESGVLERGRTMCGCSRKSMRNCAPRLPPIPAPGCTDRSMQNVRARPSPSGASPRTTSITPGRSSC